MKSFLFYLSILFPIFLVQPEFVLADTIPDSTQIYGIWDLSGSPYVIMGLATIPSGSTLLIEPGVCVEFKSSTNDSAFVIQYLDIGWIKAYGNMNAQGTESDSIIFTSSGEGNWGGIHFLETSQGSLLKHCSIRKCRSISDELIPGETYPGGLTFNNSQAVIESSDLSYNYIGVFAWNSDIILTQNRISNNIRGVNYFESSGNITSTLVSNNYDYGISSHTSSVNMNNNVIEEQLQGIQSYESNDTIIGNVIRDNLWGGIHITRCNSLVFRNVIYGSNSGIRCSGSPRIVNNTIINNNYFGIYCDWDAKPILINDIIYGNGSLITYDANDTVVFANCLLQVDNLPTGLIDAGGNIFNEDPMFFDPGNYDYSLSVGSPCINGGLSFFELGGEVILDLGTDQYTGSAPDIGAIESMFLGINDQSSNWSWEDRIVVYPNPSKGETIRIYCLGIGKGNLVVLNPMGSQVHQQGIRGAENVININNWPSGIYIVVVYEEGKAIGQAKIVVQ